MKHNVCSDFEIKQKNLGDLSKGSAQVKKNFGFRLRDDDRAHRAA